MIPEFDDNDNLPPGIHWATWDEFLKEFSYTAHRLRLCHGLYQGITSLAQAGCKTVYIDGSFVTKKIAPNDFDACWDELGIDWAKLKRIDATILDARNSCAAQKAKYGGHFAPAFTQAGNDENLYINFFQMDRDGNTKGIVAIDLKGIKI
jgi:hypothetical protein